MCILFACSVDNDKTQTNMVVVQEFMDVFLYENPDFHLKGK